MLKPAARSATRIHNAKYHEKGEFMKGYYRRKKEKLRELKKLFQVRFVYHPALHLGLDYSARPPRSRAWHEPFSV
jgi:hypothetical protein